MFLCFYVVDGCSDGVTLCFRGAVDRGSRIRGLWFGIVGLIALVFESRGPFWTMPLELTAFPENLKFCSVLYFLSILLLSIIAFCIP